ncbi:hypothetical protein BKA56DRAFT_240218 [Ilyonectria sp. MPI-CAGE-AT-0026]|nr:hypothetical protein BKA56DRAFT_240218 [Ilyonectria sp. MPI-CAGE-AT-0026]
MIPQRITDVYPFQKQCALNIDYQGQEHRVCWSGDWRRPPDLSLFPVLDGATSEHIPHGPEVDKLWSVSRAIRHGSDSHIRELNNCADGFPICKVANDERQRLLVQDEFSLLWYFSKLHPNLPVVRISSEPLQDERGIFGFKMEKLYGISLEDLAGCLGEVEAAIEGIHKARVIHYDLSISNIMSNRDGEITLIDFGRGGFIGDGISLGKEKGIKPTGKQIYSTSWDLEALQKIHEVGNWQASVM